MIIAALLLIFFSFSMQESIWRSLQCPVMIETTDLAAFKADPTIESTYEMKWFIGCPHIAVRPDSYGESYVEKMARKLLLDELYKGCGNFNTSLANLVDNNSGDKIDDLKYHVGKMRELWSKSDTVKPKCTKYEGVRKGRVCIERIIDAYPNLRNAFDILLDSFRSSLRSVLTQNSFHEGLMDYTENFHKVNKWLLKLTETNDDDYNQIKSTLKCMFNKI